MRPFAAAAGFLFFLLVQSLPGFAAPDYTKPLIDPEFVIPDHGAAEQLLEERFLALRDHYRALKDRSAQDSIDSRLEELFLPDTPEDFRARYRRQLLIAEGKGDHKTWLELAEDYLERGRLGDATAAAQRVYRDSKLARQRAAALAVMAEAALGSGDQKLAINLYQESLDIQNTADARQRLAVLIERYDLRLKDIALNVEQKVPAACLIFSQDLSASLPIDAGDYLQVAPAADLAIEAKGNRICLKGLRHGGRYKVTVFAGLPGKDGGRLYGRAERSFEVPDRAPRIIFSRGAYVLPATAGGGLPVKSVNLDSIDLRLYRIDDRNLAPAIVTGLLDGDLYPGSENQIDYTSGSRIWEGSLEVRKIRNREVTHLIALPEILVDPQPGIYALVARDPQDDRNNSWERQATQWLVITDLGLTSYQGRDGLHVLVTSLADATPLAKVRLSLVARNNRILGEIESDAMGFARFDPGLLRGHGGDQPALVTARGEAGDYNFLKLIGPYLDVSERGVAGRPSSGNLDAYLYSDRGVYRPGERVQASMLLRDAAAAAVPKAPVTLKLQRPGGVTVLERSVTGDALGGYHLEIPLSPAAPAGSWSLSAYLDDESSALGSMTFLVEDFVPQRIETTLTSELEELLPGTLLKASFAGRFLYGPPAADLRSEARATLLVDPRPFAGYEKFQFGLVQEDFRPERRNFDTPNSDAEGKVPIAFRLEDLPDSSHPLALELEARIFDLSGRPVASSLRLPLRARAVEVGLRPLFSGSLDKSTPATFEVVALDRAAQPVAARKLDYEILREHYDYSWYRQGNEWRVRQIVYDEAVSSGHLESGSDGLAQLSHRLDEGRYRLELYDSDGSSAASLRFSVGWWASATRPDVPDALELSLARANLNDGDSLTAFVRAPFAGQAVITVMSDRLLHRDIKPLPAEGLEISLPVQADWAPGAYLMVTALRPESGTASRLPHRAMGLAWFALDRAEREVTVDLDLPDVLSPRQSVQVPFAVSGAETSGEKIRLTLAAVDEGILRLTDFASPDPADHYLGQRRLGMGLRDLYGQLIQPADGPTGRLRSGGDRALAMENAQGVSLRSSKTVALYQRDVEIGPEGRGQFTLDLPDFNGTLRFMAVAYGARLLGKGEARVIVRDPLVADLLLPRFLAPGDSAQASLALHNLSGRDQEVRISLNAEGPLSMAEGDPAIHRLSDQERLQLPIQVDAVEPGAGIISLRVSMENGEDIVKTWDLAVRPAQPIITQRRVTMLAAGDTHRYGENSLEEFWPQTLSVNLTLTNRPDFNAADLLKSLDRYPYGCTEQVISRALPLLYFAVQARVWDKTWDDLSIQRRIDHAIARIMDRQRADGSFAVWNAFGRSHHWLSAYAFDFLTRAREAGYDVPTAAYDQAAGWLRRTVAQRRGGRLYAQAYAYYALARVGEAGIGELRYFAQTYGDRIETRLGLAQLAGAFAFLGDSERAEKYFAAAIAKRRPKGRGIMDYGSDLRDGSALAALLGEAFPGTRRHMKLADVLEREFDRRRHFSTQEQAWLLLANHSFLQEGGSDHPVLVDGTAEDAGRKPIRLELDRARIASGLAVANLSDRPLRLIEARRGVPKDPLPAYEDGFTLTRTFYRPDGSLADPGNLRRNEELIVLLQGKSENDGAGNALLVDLLPAGLEIENAALGGGDVTQFPFLPELTKPAFQAARDDRFVTALDLERKGQGFAVAYLVRAVTPGDFMLPGAFIEDMYRPRYQARGESARLIVRAD